MKATIKDGGCLVISPENELEVYALKKWKESSKEGRGSPVLTSTLKVDPSLPEQGIE